MVQRFCYARVSTNNQDLSTQVEKLKNLYPESYLYAEVISSRKP